MHPPDEPDAPATPACRPDLHSTLGTDEASERRFRDMVYRAQVAIVVFDRRLRPRYANTRYREITGMEEEELIRQGWRALFPGELQGQLDALEGEFLRGTVTGGGPLTLERPDGERRHVYVRWGPLDETVEDATLFVLTAEDVTELHRARLRIRELARRLENARDESDFRTALMLQEGVAQDLYSVKLLVASLGRAADASTAAEIRTGIDTALARAMARLRHAADSLRPVGLEHLPLGTLLEAEARRRLEPAGIAWRVAVAGPAELTRPATLMLLRAAREFLDNVVAHAGARNVAIAWQPDAGGWTLRVEDDGVGADAGQVRDDALGLLAVEERATDLGGRLSIERHARGGTRAAVWLPAAACSG